MPFTIPYSSDATQSSMGPPQGGEMLIYVSHVNSGPINAQAGNSIEAAPGYDRRWLLWIPMSQQPNFPPDEASITDFYYITNENTLDPYPQTQSQEIEGDLTTQSATEDRINSTTDCTGKPRLACASCTKDFGRIQELKRHMKDKHKPPHPCPFSSCPFMWTRPCKLKDHLLADHEGGFSPEILEAIKPLRGQNIVKFLNGYAHTLSVEAALQPVVQAPQFPFQL